MSVFDEKIACLMIGMGTEINQFVTCLVTAEIASLQEEAELIQRKIIRLQGVLDGSACNATPPA